MDDNNYPTMLRDHHYQELVSAGNQYPQFYDGGGVAASVSASSVDGGVLFSGITQATGVVDSSAASLAGVHGISMEWTPDEQAILDDGMIKYASESNVARYAKIAVKLNNKTVRDVALRCKWTAKKDIGKRRKEDHNLTKKGKDRKEKVSDRLAMSSHVVTEAGWKELGVIHSAVEGDHGQLLRQNVQAFDKIIANLQANQIQGNIPLLCQARKNILQILNNLSNPQNTVRQMPPLLVEIDRNLANTILPHSPE